MAKSNQPTKKYTPGFMVKQIQNPVQPVQFRSVSSGLAPENFSTFSMGHSCRRAIKHGNGIFDQKQ